jgi:hypothetical protein
MNAYEQYLNAPPTESEWIAREEAIERSEERRLLALDLSFEYSDELREFTGKRATITDETGCTLAEVAGFPTTAGGFMERFGARRAA